MNETYLLAVDQGTSATKAVVVDGHGQIRARAVAPLASSYPEPGWVEQDPEGIYKSVLAAEHVSGGLSWNYIILPPAGFIPIHHQFIGFRQDTMLAAAHTAQHLLVSANAEEADRQALRLHR